jgi:7-keto-8-aminopelargonate synthetase-like enzyme
LWIAPAVDDNAARLRLFIKTTHTAEQIRTAVEHLATMGA